MKIVKRKCEICEKEISGLSESQVEYLLKQHIMAKHFAELEKQGFLKILRPKKDGGS